MTIREAAERAATATRNPYSHWYPVMHRWWAAGHDLGIVVAWVESQQVSPAFADAAIPLANAAKVKAEEFEQAMARVTETMNAETPDELRARADRIEARSCTGLTASWCPVHGDCTCIRNPWPTYDDRNCPLHGLMSSHAA